MTPLYEYKRRIDAVLRKKIPAMRLIDDERVGAPWECVQMRQNERAYQYAYHVPIGFSALDVEKQVDALFAACGAHIEIVDRAGVVVISVFPDDLPAIIHFTHSMIDGLTGLNVLLGYDRVGRPVTHNFHVHPHMMIGSLPNYGKTTIIRLITYQLLRRIPMNMLRIKMLDPKSFSFLPFMGVPNVEVATDMDSSLRVVSGVMDEINRRAEIVLDRRNRGYIKRFPFIFLIVDEAAQYSPKIAVEREKARTVDKWLARVSTLARESRINLIYCTQRPDSEVVNAQIRSMMTAFLGFRTNDEHSSKIIIKSAGLERLPASVKGRAIYFTDQQRVIQTPYVTAKRPPKGRNAEDYAWERLLERYKTGGALFDYYANGRDQKRIETDYIGDDGVGTDRLDGPHRQNNRLNTVQPTETRFGIDDGFDAGETGGWIQSSDRGAKDLAFDENGPINLSGYDEEPGSDDDESDSVD